MRRIDREGIFKAIPYEWCINAAPNSSAVAVTIQYQILAQWNGSDWDDWSSYEEHEARGDHYVIGRNGQVNTNGVEQLAEALGWTGDMRAVTGAPPDITVQITVKAEEYNGQKRYKVSWLRPGDYTPRPQGASEEQVQQLQLQFGSLLRAAASAAASAAVPATSATPGNSARPAVAASSKPATTTATVPRTGDDDLPF